MFKRGEIVQVKQDDDVRIACIVGFEGERMICEDVVTFEKFLAEESQLAHTGWTMDDEI